MFSSSCTGNCSAGYWLRFAFNEGHCSYVSCRVHRHNVLCSLFFACIGLQLNSQKLLSGRFQWWDTVSWWYLWFNRWFKNIWLFRHLSDRVCTLWLITLLYYLQVWTRLWPYYVCMYHQNFLSYGLKGVYPMPRRQLRWLLHCKHPPAPAHAPRGIKTCELLPISCARYSY